MGKRFLKNSPKKSLFIIVAEKEAKGRECVEISRHKLDLIETLGSGQFGDVYRGVYLDEVM